MGTSKDYHFLQSPQSLVVLTLLVSIIGGCQKTEYRDRQSRPAESTEDTPELLDEVEVAITSNESKEINLGEHTILTIPEDALPFDGSVRLRRRAQLPQEIQALEIGSPIGPIVEISIFNSQRENFVSSVFRKPYDFTQVLQDIDQQEEINYVVVSSFQSETDESVSVIDDSAISRQMLLLSSRLKASVKLRLTDALVFAVKQARKLDNVDIVKDTEQLSNTSIRTIPASTGGGTVTTINVDCAGLNGGQWVFVPGDPTTGLGGATYAQGTRTLPNGTALASADFCVMKYEAKAVGNDDGANAAFGNDSLPESRMTGNPWSNLSRDQAIIACERLGPGYVLLNNAMWQAIARNIETAKNTSNVLLNWLNYNGSQVVNIGNSHVFSQPVSATTDSDPCFRFFYADCSADMTSSTAYWKRTHTLSNGKTIWDFAGNAAEWIQDELPTSEKLESEGYAVNNPMSNQQKWGPTSIVSGAEYPAMGMGAIQFSNSHNGDVMRGGGSSFMRKGGIFSAFAQQADTTAGFRCAWVAR